MTQESLLSVRDLEKTYVVRGLRSEHRVPAVRGVSFEVGHGEALGLVGASGSGKSTIGRSLLQLERPDRGEVVFQGIDLCRLRGKRLRSARLAMQAVFQDPLGSLDPRLLVKQSVAEPLEHRGLGPREVARLVGRALELVGLYGKRDSRPEELSGGEAQRVAIARAVICGPKLIILDEPTSALDVSIQAQILNLLRDLRDETNSAYFFISHDLGVINAVCERVLVMRHGEIVESGPSEQILRQPTHEYTAALVGAALGEVAPELGPPRDLHRQHQHRDQTGHGVGAERVASTVARHKDGRDSTRKGG